VAELQVEVVAADHKVWEGEATMVVARTTDGDIGILPGHAPLLGLLVSGAVRIMPTDGDTVVAAVHGGFLSVSDDAVAVLAETAEIADDIDVARAEQALERARGADPDDEDAKAAGERAEARLAAAGRS
jgi:F-type H+-transporting ATPase subunit epsilon